MRRREFIARLGSAAAWPLAARVYAAVCVCAGVLVAQQSAFAQNAGSGPEQGGPYGTLEIRDVTVIDGSGVPAFGPVNIYPAAGRIVSLG